MKRRRKSSASFPYSSRLLVRTKGEEKKKKKGEKKSPTYHLPAFLEEAVMVRNEGGEKKEREGRGGVMRIRIQALIHIVSTDLGRCWPNPEDHLADTEKGEEKEVPHF